MMDTWWWAAGRGLIDTGYICRYFVNLWSLLQISQYLSSLTLLYVLIWGCRNHLHNYFYSLDFSHFYINCRAELTSKVSQLYIKASLNFKADDIGSVNFEKSSFRLSGLSIYKYYFHVCKLSWSHRYLLFT